MKIIITLTVLSLFLAPTMSPAQVINGSFESPDATASYYLLAGGSTAIPGWTAIDSGVEWFQPLAYGTVPAPDGLYIVDIANYTYSAGGLMQTISTDPGTIYHINFSLGTSQHSGRDGTCEIIVSADGQSETFSMENHLPEIAFEPRSFTFVADDSEADLSFRCLQNANTHFANIDGINTDGTVSSQAGTLESLKALYR